MLLAAEWSTTPHEIRQHTIGDLQIMRQVVIERRRAAAGDDEQEEVSSE